MVTARGDKAAVPYQFGPDSLSCTATNATDEPLSLFVALDRATAALSDGGTDIRKAPVTQEEWGTAAAYSGGRRLRLNGGTRLWTAPGEPNPIWYAALGPRQTRTVVLQAGAASADEAARIAALDASYRVAAGGGGVEGPELRLRDVAGRPEGARRLLVAGSLGLPDLVAGRALAPVQQPRPTAPAALAGGPPEDFPTGEVKPQRDYALTADGKRLGFTSGDSIYVVPAAGGEPAPILPKKQGYVHGWSPDGRTVVYTAGRGKGPLSIFSRLADGGEETRLLAYAGFSDAPELFARRQMDLLQL